MEYQEFLFAQLFLVINPELQDLEYDLLFDEIEPLYEEYKTSNFNTDLLSDYDCICNFLNNKKK